MVQKVKSSGAGVDAEARNIATFMKSHGAKLLPFVASIAMYFVYFIPEYQPSMFAMALKCFPILSLALFVYLLGIDNSLRQNVFRGLLLSVIGDACLLWEQEAFVYGVTAFGLAQMHFIAAHGWKPLNIGILVVVLILAVPGMALIAPGVLAQPLVTQLAVSFYSPLLLTVLWRGVASSRHAKETQPEIWTLQCASLGGILFLISDFILSVNKFHGLIPYHQLIVMCTYYGSQFMTSLSSFKQANAVSECSKSKRN